MSDKQNLVVIDGDSIPYLCGKTDLVESLVNVNSMIQSVLKSTKADCYAIALSKSPYFRHKLYPEYKGNRLPSTIPWLKTLRTYLMEAYQAFYLEGVEADDVVTWCKYNLYNYNVTIAAMDKDILYQVPGNHYDYRNRAFVKTSDKEAIHNFNVALLIGDRGDNIKPLRKGIGVVKAEKILSTMYQNKKTIDNVFEDICGETGSQEYNIRFNLLHMMRYNQSFKENVGYEPNESMININTVSFVGEEFDW